LSFCPASCGKMWPKTPGLLENHDQGRDAERHPSRLLLPQGLGCSSGRTCWRRLRNWNQASFWLKIHRLRCYLREADKVDWSRRAVIASASVWVVFGDQTSSNPTDGSKAGSKHHVVTDADGIPLAAKGMLADGHNVLLPLVASIPPVGGRTGLALSGFGV